MSAADIAIRIELPWIPREELRGNSRAHFQVKARHASQLQERGYRIRHCRQDLNQAGILDYPITGPLALDITAWNRRQCRL